MTETKSSGKRLILLMVPLILLLGGAATFLHLQQAKPYKTLTLGETDLYVPRDMLAEEKADLANMFRDYIGTVELERYQITVDAKAILPKDIVGNVNVAESSIIWTIEDAGTNRGALLENDKALFFGLEPHQGRTLSSPGKVEPDDLDHQNIAGLTKLNRSASGASSYALSNANPEETNDVSGVWVAHCIELSSVVPGRPWGRCTNQFEHRGIKVQIHYDGRLVKKTDTVANTVRKLIDDWHIAPKS